MNDYVIAKYIRLSIDDGITESLSIPNQRKMLDQFIKELDMPSAIVLEFVDNGYSGTNMNRPAIQELLELVQCGRINCVIVKDFSRYSRDALESAFFIEQMCPLLGIRFISAGDRFDSNDYKEATGGIDVSFKYLTHEFYSKDLSQKVKSSKRIQMARGDNIVASAIYGYRKNDGGQWEPDPVPADVVRQIFQMALQGMATAQIRDKLCAERYPTPREYIKLKRGKDIKPACVWTARMILHMLTNEQYTGSYVSGKQESKAIGSHSKIHVDKSTWIIIPDRHPAIVSKEDFAKAQELLNDRKGSMVTKPLQSDMSRPKRARMAQGEHIAATSIYGYMKTDGGKWEIDEAAGRVIREIFEMAAQGLSCAEICVKLFERGYSTPSEYIKRARGHAVTPVNRWTKKSVQGILKNEQYTGSYVSGKILMNYETGKSYHTPQSEWIVIPDSHPALVSKEIFAGVQEITARNRFKRKNMKRREYLLHGKIACGCCKHALMYDDSTENKSYRCIHTYADPNAECHKMKADAPELEEAVLDIIRKHAEVVLGSADLTGIKKTPEDAQRIAGYEAQIGEANDRRRIFYERYLHQEIDMDTFLTLKKECTEKINNLNKQLRALKNSQFDGLAKKKSVEIAKNTLSESAVPRELVEALIEKIYVFPDNQIEINWKISQFETADSITHDSI